MRNLKIFLASSSENKKIAELIQEMIVEYDDKHDWEIMSSGWWEPGIFREGLSFYESLNNLLQTHEAAIILAGEEDLTIKRGKPNFQPRDNLILELGLFAGSKGREFALLATVEIPTLPSDLSGIKHLNITHKEGMDAEEFKVRNRAKIRSWLKGVIEQIELQETKSDISTLDPETKALLKEMTNGITKAMKVKHQLFRQKIRESLELFHDNIGNWEKGQLFIGPENSTPFLLSLYKLAKNKVFSTSVKDFSGAWQDESFGFLILDAHKKSTAEVTRMFLFDDEHQVASDDLMEMEKQISIGVNVCIFLERYSAFNIPTPIAKDFTIIDDGEIIGITEAVRNNRIAARYYFEDTFAITTFRMIANKLLENCLSYDDFTKTYGKRM